MDLNGYGFNEIGSLEEYFAYDIDEYYESIQMTDGFGKNGFVVPILVNKRIRFYELSEFTREHEKEIMKAIG